MHADLNSPDSQAADASSRFSASLVTCPVIAILRGVTPDKVLDVCSQLVDIGICVIEVPLNSPSALRSIEMIKQSLGDQILCGAGTVTQRQQVVAVKQAGGDIILSPHLDVQVIKACIDNKLVGLPGIATPTEAFSAINAGCQNLKVFPASVLTPAFVTALQAVLPPQIGLIPVGGIKPSSLPQWLNTGVSGVGIGSDLYHPNDSKLEFKQKIDYLHQALLARQSRSDG